MLLPVISFLLMTFIIGIYSAARIRGQVKNFYVAGNIIPVWVLVASLVGQAVEIGSTQVNANYAITGQFWVGIVLPLGIGISLILTGLFYAEPLHRMKLLTLPDFYFRRFDRRTESAASILCLLGFIILTASNLAGAALLLNFALGLPILHGVAGIALLVMIYAMAGGLFAVTWNDVLHVGVMAIGSLGALCWMIGAHPWHQLLAAVNTNFSLEPLYRHDQGALATWAALLALALGDVVALDFMERVFAAKTPRYAKVSCLLAGAVTIAFGLALALFGMMATAVATPDNTASGGAILDFASRHLPVGLSMVFLMAILASCISTIDGAIMACSSVITKNLVQQNFPTLIPRHRLLPFSRLCMIPVTLIAIIIAIIKPDPGDLLVLAFDLVFAGCFIPLTLGIYWKRSTANAAFWAILIPSLLRVLLQYTLPAHLKGLDTLIPPILSLALMIGISLREPPAQAPAPAKA